MLRVDNLIVLGRLCSSGLGLAVLPHYFTDYYKNLELILNPEIFIGSDLWILTHKNNKQNPRVKICSEFLFTEIKSYLQK